MHNFATVRETFMNVNDKTISSWTELYKSAYHFNSLNSFVNFALVFVIWSIQAWQHRCWLCNWFRVDFHNDNFVQLEYRSLAVVQIVVRCGRVVEHCIWAVVRARNWLNSNQPCSVCRICVRFVKTFARAECERHSCNGRNRCLVHTTQVDVGETVVWWRNANRVDSPHFVTIQIVIRYGLNVRVFEIKLLCVMLINGLTKLLTWRRSNSMPTSTMLL